jgi:hypothetical protein
MANHFRLFSRPLMADDTATVMTITGVLEDYLVGEAYESRLDINNSIGRCTVEILGESSLPSGTSVRVDNVTKEIVVKWAAHEAVEGDRAVPNGSFEDGDDGTWNKGSGWTIGTGAGYSTQSGTYSARFASVTTAGSELLGVPVPAKPGDRIRLVGQVQQGASSKGNAGAQVALVFSNLGGSTLLRKYGGMVSSGSGGAWGASVAEETAPAETAFVRVLVKAFRKSENKPLWVDSLRWDHTYTIGQNDDGESYFLSIKVTDAENRVAYWSGWIEAGLAYGTLTEYLPTSFSQSSVFYLREATTNNMRDDVSVLSGANTGNSFVGGEWLMADLGAAYEVSKFVLGTGTLVGMNGDFSGGDLGGWHGQFYQIECSSDGDSWQVLSHTYRFVGSDVAEIPPGDYELSFTPTTARYWRVHQTGGGSIRTRTFRLYGYVGGLTKASCTYTQSSNSVGLVGNSANLNEFPNNITTGAATGNSSSEWIMADLGSIHDLKLLVVAGGDLPGWGGSAGTYLAGPTVLAETSLDGVTWTLHGYLSAFISDVSPITEVGVDITGTGRYVRIHKSGYLSTTAMRVYHT